MRKVDSSKYVNLSDEEIVALFQQIDDDKALEFLLSKYNNWIHKVATKYYFKTNLENEDILAYAFIGFIEGVNKFNTERDGYFMYFTGVWMRTKILWAIDTYNNLVKIPVNKLKDMRKIKLIISANNFEFYSIDDLVDLVDIPVDKLNKYLNLDFRIINSLDFKYVEDTDTSIYTHFNSEDLKEDLILILEKFTETEQYILLHFFGLFNETKMNNVEIGEYLGISSERVRQIKDKCIRKLRHSSFTFTLNQYLN